MHFSHESQVIEVLRKACLMSNESSQEVNANLKYCDKTFDGLFCWPRTLAGELAMQPCDGQLLRSVRKDGIAKKLCTEDGTWFTKENETAPWSNLSECVKFYVDVEMEKFENVYEAWLPFIKSTAYVGYALSIVSLVFALVIFVSIRSLHCERNRLHIHFFISFLMRGCTFLLKDTLFVKGTALIHETTFVDGQPKFTNESYTWACKTIISIRYYFIIANFTFMLMEGMYLHNLMFLNLFSDNHGTKIYCLVGWVLPAVFVIPWAILKNTFDDIGCWTEKNNVYVHLLIELPIGITVTLNFILFLIIVRVLIVKLNFSVAFIQRKIRYRKLVKSTLILILLFGIPYVISLGLSFFTKTSQTLEITWLFFDQTFAAFQGIFAALVYCILNGEVQSEIHRKYFSLRQKNAKEFRRSRTISHTQQLSMHALDEAYENTQFFANTNLSDCRNKFEETTEH